MGKIRVHELAKELGRSSAEVIDVLSDLGVKEAKAQSSLEDELAAKIRGRLNGAARKPAAATEAEAKGEAPAEAPKKKKFVAVFRRENARSGVISRMPTRQAQMRSAQAQAEAQGRPLRRRPVDANGNPIPVRRPVDAQGRPLPRRVDANGKEGSRTGNRHSGSGTERTCAAAECSRTGAEGSRTETGICRVFRAGTEGSRTGTGICRVFRK